MKKHILDLTHTEAREYFLKQESYFNFDLPKYFVFGEIIEKISTKIDGRNLSDFYATYTDSANKTKAYRPCNFENLNYKILNNKDGKFAWRPIQLIHPAIYVSLVHKITEMENWKLITDRFHVFQENHRIKCLSLPLKSINSLSDKAASVNNWWKEIEQRSIELGLKYEYVLHTDITDCYGSIYTHSIPWALHTKTVAKGDRDNNVLIGNIIDEHIRNMSFGQTNGIPQGSNLMDFIAEMVLGYVDLELTSSIQNAGIQDYEILRYRDDYRIFTNNPQECELITKFLTESLIDLGMRLNVQKTLTSNNIIRDSIKPDKLFWMREKKTHRNLQEYLLVIHDLSINFPNSGSLNKSLSKFYTRIKNLKNTRIDVYVLISIVIDIAYKNPRVYPISAAILSKLLSLLSECDKISILDKILYKFDKIPNTGYLKVWIQRITLKIDRQKDYNEDLCLKINDPNIQIWNSDWLMDDFKNLISSVNIINEDIIKNIDTTIEESEVLLFETKTDYEY